LAFRLDAKYLGLQNASAFVILSDSEESLPLILLRFFGRSTPSE